MPTSEEDLQAKRDAVAKLRDQVAAATAESERKAREQDNDVAMAQLEAEEIRLQTQLAQAKESGKAANVKAGVAPVLGAAQDQVRLAVEQQKSAEALRVADAEAAKKARDAAKADAVADVQNVVAKQGTTEGAPDAERSN